MKSFVIALLIFALIGVLVFVFCGIQEKNIRVLLERTECLSVEEDDFSEMENRTSVQKVQEIWQEKLWLLELAVEEEYLTPITASIADMIAGTASGDLSRYLSGKAGVIEGLLKLEEINQISISQIF